MKLRVAVAIALTLALLVPGVALADTNILDRGLYGEHSLRDRRSNPGAVCMYDNAWSQLQSIGVRAPRVFARDLTASEDSQDVGWQFWIKRRVEAARWVTVYASSTQIATGTDATAAAFTRMSTTFVPNYPGPFRVVVRMFWYDTTGAIEGMSKHWVDHYARRTEQDSGAHERVCQTGYV